MAGGKVKTPAKSQGKDIRGFFGGGSQAAPAATASSGRASKSDGSSVQNTARKMEERHVSQNNPHRSHSARPIEISDEDDSKVKKISKSPHPRATEVPKSQRVMEEDDISPRPVRKRKAVLLSSDDEDADMKTTSPPKKKAAVATYSSPQASSSKVVAAAPKAKSSTKGAVSRNVHAGGKTPKKKRKDDDFIASSSEDEDEDYVVDEEEEPPKRAQAKSKAQKKAPTKEALAGKSHENDDEVVDEENPKPKFNWAAARAAKMAGPVAPGSKSVPQPAAPDCLAGLAFVFTGELTSFSREEAIELAKRNGGRVTLQPSSKTSYVILGSDAGPSKLAAIKKNNLKTLDEDGFLNLIATRVPDASKLDDKTKKKREKEKEAIRTAAAEMEKREKKAMRESGGTNASMKQAVTNQLWTDRYAPQTVKEICGNKGPSSLKSSFKKPGKDGMNVFRAVLITGPPGIGKTTSAHMCAKLEGFTPIELNASDARSKKLVENSTNIANTSLDGWMTGGTATNAAGVTITDKTCLIMDEVDGMSAGDRGGVGALSALIRKTKIPIICIANDRGALKLKPLANVAFNLTYRKPEVNAIRSRILSIAFKEKMKVPANVIDQLIEGAQSDIRQVLNMLSTWKLSSDTMDFDEGKALAKMNEKYAIMTPFNVTNKLLGPYLFSPTARETLNDKMELYFHDHSFIPLFIQPTVSQENYLKTQPTKVKTLEGPEKILRQLSLMDKAASSLSDGDLVDSLIHGPEQHWSLMPLHAVCSTVRPASFLYGMGIGYAGPNAMSFPQWLGQNSKQTKLTRQLTEVQARMRIKVSGDKSEIRQSYIPALFPHVVKPLIEQGASAVDEVIGRMDEYFISREDWDTIIELGVDQNKDDLVLKKISTATKTSFTKKYNSRDHPIPFHKAQDLGKIPKKLAAAGPMPDLEEAIDVDDEAEDIIDEPEVSDNDIARDSLIKAPKKSRGAARTSAPAKGKA
ncbi:uncharacterized protein FIBRA_07144 [Fibroporia radiculosa]|uniref:Replication factor C subunit 1 n=1 Tax=Fibroporia radiculosa TaxID=599839 RepID=J4I083_9APHY|nr:uncharacterized protein FIBRA_07144 [Fibroporia radiculosa]CCM04947.1 predicted protein [Fibroporia radiculosa]